jgi:hypothetical protein
VDDTNPTSPKLIVTALEKASLFEEQKSQILLSIPVSSFAVFARSDSD